MSADRPEEVESTSNIDRSRDDGMTMTQETISSPVGTLPPSCLGPDGKIIRLTEEERKAWCEAARQRLAEIAQMPDDDPPGAFEEFMRGIDEGRPHRPMYKGMY
jgi:hypothetical protein